MIIMKVSVVYVIFFNTVQPAESVVTTSSRLDRTEEGHHQAVKHEWWACRMTQADRGNVLF